MESHRIGAQTGQRPGGLLTGIIKASGGTASISIMHLLPGAYVMSPTLALRTTDANVRRSDDKQGGFGKGKRRTGQAGPTAFAGLSDYNRT